MTTDNTANNPFNFIPLKPTGRNETNSANTYTPDDMVKIYEQQFLIPVPDDKLAEFLPALKAFYDIDNNTLDVSAIIFEAIADYCIIYNHKVKVGDYQILGELVAETLAEDYKDEEGAAPPAYTLDCVRTFYISDVALDYHFNLFIQGDGYSTLAQTDTLLEQMYWLVQEDTLDAMSLATINKQLAGFGIRAVDMTTVRELVSYIEDSIIGDDIIEVLNKLLDDVE
ncbi:hypothetical protein [Psychrobacter sp. M13]|uniref:hypothetical protein n=1 Tax=Psychrobacter sp. M13 TaxID=3067275 RepID=UPI00273CB051|nr:hypothetical protein [Psychrobacter sp. M13]WLP93691.1 hypothetical protein Q9G97_08805 [Psychrobacter sp. M13]